MDIKKLKGDLEVAFPDLTVRYDSTLIEDRLRGLEYTYMYGYKCDDPEKCECFGLKIYAAISTINVDHIKYEKAEKCTLSGTEILHRLVSVFKHTDSIREVSLYDVAKYYMHGTSIRVWIYSVLLHGISWYNRFGFKSDMHDHEVQHNEKIATSPITPMLLKKINAELSGEPLAKGTTLREFAHMVDRKIKSTSPESEKKTWLNAYQILEEWIEKGKKLKYQYFTLKLKHTKSHSHEHKSKRTKIFGGKHTLRKRPSKKRS